MDEWTSHFLEVKAATHFTSIAYSSFFDRERPDSFDRGSPGIYTPIMIIPTTPGAFAARLIVPARFGDRQRGARAVVFSKNPNISRLLVRAR